MNEIVAGTKSDFRTLLHDEDSAGNWLPPKIITMAMKVQARAILADLPARFEQVTQESTRAWLASLGTLCAGRMSMDEAQTRVMAYADMLGEMKYPSGCFTKASLKRCALKFQWFPSLAELTTALDAERVRLHKERHRLNLLLNPPDVDRFKTREPPSAEQQAKVAEAIRQAGLDIKATTKSEPEAA